MSTRQVILLRVEAPAKPAFGAPCNGCGVCCATEPCPLGVVISRRRTGTCDALVWDEEDNRYSCGAIVNPQAVLPRKLAWLAPSFTVLAKRWIAAGKGCDASLRVESPDVKG